MLQQSRRLHHWAPFVLAAITSIGLFGCPPDSGVGDPCDPESVPEGGFNGDESYLETSSVQCRTRVCMVYQLEGDPRRIIDETPDCLVDSTGCVTNQQIEESIFCSCRCQAAEGSSLPTCSCGDGFRCEPDLLELGGEGIRGGYCVPDL